MKRVQNWRDYLDETNQVYKQKINKKKKKKFSEDSDQTSDKTKYKRK
jgi:hypothetical protein